VFFKFQLEKGWNKTVKTFGVALLGAGRMGMEHARNLVGISSARVLAVGDPVLENAQKAVTLTRAEKAYADAEAAIHHPGVDAVVIVTPTDTHAALIQKAARAGNAVWCEKPIALTLADTQETINVLEETGVPCQIGFMRRFDPGYARAKRMIEDPGARHVPAKPELPSGQRRHVFGHERSRF
jgi:myo-inositol 2-dehydrogenase / D-chiro-inositol 1-dehydrogenase